jgi:hypothetical protein
LLLSPSHLYMSGCWSTLPSLVASTSLRREIFVPPMWPSRVMFCLLSCAVGVVGAATRVINLPHLYFRTGGNLHGVISKLIATCASRSFRSAACSSHCSSDLAILVSLRVANVLRYPQERWGPGFDGCKARMLVQRWWIYRYSPTSSMECGGSWSKAA